MKNLRTQGKSLIVWILMGLLVLGLGGFGVTSFSGGSVEIGSVGDTKVTADEYARSLQNEINSYSRQTGQPFSMAQAQAIGLPQAVQAQLFTGAALEEQARRIGVSVGDERVRQTILEADAFTGPNGNFDRVAYAEILRRERMSEAEFEAAVRTDEARMLIQRAVVGGVTVPEAMVHQTTKWLLETRDLSWRELTEDDVSASGTSPDEETLKSWHQANAARFTAAEIRKLTYVWLTPEALAGEVDLDEKALRDLYEASIDQYRQPERRIVGRLVFSSRDEAEAAKASIDAGEQPFEAFVLQRGLTLDDVDLGEMTRQDLGAAGDAVFALEQPGVVGPVDTDLGPALFSMNAILEPVDIPFEKARADLRQEAALDRAARIIDDRSGEFEDLLAGGATLEEVADETPMQLGQIDWIAGEPAEEGSIAGYEAFREQAAQATEADFPQLTRLADGGVFALRVDQIVPPTLKPFDEVRDAVADDWRAAEIHRQLLARAEEMRVQASAAAASPGPDVSPSPDAGTSRVATPEAPEDAPRPDAAGEDPAADSGAGTGQASPAQTLAWRSETDVTRDGWIESVPAEIIARAFSIDQTGEIEVVDAGNRVFLVRLDAIGEADLTSEDALRVMDAVTARLSQTLQADLFDYYARAAQRLGGLQLNQSAINAIDAQVQ
ncbi:SurA N-terminal domain-containing protein [Paracoccus salsus]|uniref:SurA N-terminal domain-containing protein n=1 Tax=Paracoccus salsus TaxID=2911061 RepID=UPI001F37FF3F|nr:SurA N-terminal domain-containing protein [Paracoccus salsus]MCF3972269.1 SurA N-terminal domain-containing protein [Paracoccus salsus]